MGCYIWYSDERTGRGHDKRCDKRTDEQTDITAISYIAFYTQLVKHDSRDF